MKKLLLAILLMAVFAIPAFGQRVNEEIVTESDIQIRFPGAELPGEDGWYQPSVVSIEYSVEPVSAVHKTKGRLGFMKWEFWLQAGFTDEKVVVVIDLQAMPQGFRIMQLRARVGWMDGVDYSTGPWSEPSDSVKIIGKPSEAKFVY